MRQFLACIAFVQAGGGLNMHVPSQVDTLVKNRIARQFQALAREELKFDAHDCASKGTYYYTMDSIVLQSQSEIWQGRFESSLSDVIDGRKLDFPLARDLAKKNEELAFEAAALPDENESSASTASSPKWWVVAAVAGATALAIGAMAALHSGSGQGGNVHVAPASPAAASDNNPMMRRR